MDCNLWGFHQVLCSAPQGVLGSLGFVIHGLLETGMVWRSEGPARAQAYGLRSSALQCSASGGGQASCLAVIPKVFLGSRMQARMWEGWTPGLRRLTARGTLVCPTREMDSVSWGTAGTTPIFHLPAWLLRVKVLPGTEAAASTQQIWCDHHRPGPRGDKVRALGRAGCFCGSSSGSQESRGQGGQAGGGCDSRDEVTGLGPSGP